MVADGGTVEIDYRARLDRLERDMAQAKSKVSRVADDMGDDVSRRLASKLGGLGSIMGKALAAAGGVFAVKKGFDFVGGLIGDATESRRVLAETEQAIKATGGAANVSAKEIAGLADSLARKTGIDDEQIQSASNLLLTFKSVRNEVGAGNDIFNQATAAVLDLSKQFGGTEASAVQIGKALNDPIAGVTALTRVGIQFTDQQKDQIKAMVEAGDVLGAQKIILGEINSQVGGQAAAQATAAAKLAVVWGNLREELGTRLLPIVDKAATFLANKLPGAMDKAGAGFSSLAALLAPVVAALTSVGGFLRDNVLPVIVSVAGFVQSNFLPVVAALGAVVLTVLVPAFIAWALAAGPAAVATAIAAAPVIALAAVLAGLAFAIVYAYQHFETFRSIVDGVASFLSSVVAAAFNYIATVVTSAIDIITNVIKLGLALIRGDWSGAWEAVKGILSAAWNAIVNVIEAQFRVVNALFAGLPGKILGALGNLGSLLYGAGVSIVQGLIDGIGNMAGAVVDALLDLIPGPLKRFAHLLGIKSPSKVFAGFGMNIGEGLALGMTRSQGLVASASDSLAMAAAGFSSSGSIAGLGHSSSGDSGGSSSSGHSISVGPFYVREGDLPTEIPRRLRGALSLWS